MEILTENQPVSFCRQLNDCGCGDAIYAQLAQQTDWLSFQVRRNIVLNQSATNLIENGDFATGDLTGWTNNGDPLADPWFYDAGTAKTATAADVMFLGQNIKLKAGKKYQLLFDYDVYVPAILKVVGFKSYSDIEQEDDYDVLVEIAGGVTGSYNESIVTENEYVRIAFWHESDAIPFDGTVIDNIALYEYTGAATIEITDCESDTALATIPASAFDFFDEYYNVKIKWEDLALDPGNYCVCVRDANQFANGDFTNEDLLFWEETNDGNSWTADENDRPSVVVSRDEESAVLFQEVCLGAGTYQVCLDNITGLGQVDYELVVNGEVVADGVSIGDEICFDFTTTEDIRTIGVKVTGNSDADLTTVAFDNISLINDNCSGCFNLADDHDCSQLLSWDNDCDAFGIYYGYFRNYLRLKSKTRHPRWKITDEEFFINPSGNRALLSAYGAAVEELVIANQPGFIWGAIAIGLIHDNFFIEGISYTKNSGDVDPAWRTSQDIVSEGVVEVFRNKQPNWKNYCFKKKSSLITGCGCDLSDYYTKTESNTRYYTKSQSDARYALAGHVHTLTQIAAASTTAAKSIYTSTFNSGTDDHPVIFKDSSGHVFMSLVGKTDYPSILFGGAVYNANTTFNFQAPVPRPYIARFFNSAGTANVTFSEGGNILATQGSITVNGSGGFILNGFLLTITFGGTSIGNYYTAHSSTVGGHVFRHSATLTDPLLASVHRVIKTSSTFIPVVGSTGTFTSLSIEDTINQATGGTGITRGIHINPALTSPYDFRALEIATNVGKAIYQTGASATNYLAGKTGIGAAASTSSKLLVQGTGTGTDLTAIFRDGAGTPKNTLKLVNNGRIIMRVLTSAIADADLDPDEFNIWVDETSGTEKLDFKVKLSSGTVKSGTINLT